jgi:hypothetical protein
MSQDKLITALERHAERFRDLNRLQKELEGLPNRIENLNRQIDAEEQELVKEMKVCKRDKLCKQRVIDGISVYQIYRLVNDKITIEEIPV